MVRGFRRRVRGRQRGRGRNNPNSSRPRETFIWDTVVGTTPSGTTSQLGKPDQIPVGRSWRCQEVILIAWVGLTSSGVPPAAQYRMMPQVFQVRLLGPPERGVTTTIQPTSAIHRPDVASVIPKRMRLRNNPQQDWFSVDHASFNDVAIDHPALSTSSDPIFWICHRIYELSQEYEPDTAVSCSITEVPFETQFSQLSIAPCSDS